MQWLANPFFYSILYIGKIFNVQNGQPDLFVLQIHTLEFDVYNLQSEKRASVPKFLWNPDCRKQDCHPVFVPL